ncbi:MAG: hypothetical protein PF450_15625 [Bacteroidales bacterium]|jgi:hypothetical protein|nr:hypothetical protein [Bacteroidales bacterium]
MMKDLLVLYCDLLVKMNVYRHICLFWTLRIRQVLQKHYSMAKSNVAALKHAKSMVKSNVAALKRPKSDVAVLHRHIYKWKQQGSFQILNFMKNK